MCPLHVEAPLGTNGQEETLPQAPSLWLVTPATHSQWALLTHMTDEDSEAGRWHVTRQ